MKSLDEPGVIAIVRLRRNSAPDLLLDALVGAGIRTVEVTLPTPDSCATISRWRSRGAATVGAGTVRTAEDVDTAADAGAQFLVTPSTSGAVLSAAQARGLPVVCGALTPTEIELAARGGASYVKVFPIDAVGGTKYLKAVMAPLDDIGFVPTGGITADNAGRYASLGCAGVGVGSALVNDSAVAMGDWPGVAAQARRIVSAWQAGKSP